MFCLTFYPFQSYIRDADEIKIIYKASDRTLPEFLQEYSDKTVIIEIPGPLSEIDIKLFIGLAEQYKNFKLKINCLNEEDIFQQLAAAGVPFFFINPVTTYDLLYGFLKYHPTDMYICEDLGFQLDKVSKILHDNNVKVRVFPNICQSSYAKTDSMQTFFIRPDDIKTYSQYVDVFELVADEKRQGIVFKIYRQGYWFGQVNEIIPTFHGDLDSKYVMQNFGAIRATCGKRCQSKPGSCDICTRFTEIANDFKEHGIAIHPER